MGSFVDRQITTGVAINLHWLTIDMPCASRRHRSAFWISPQVLLSSLLSSFPLKTLPPPSQDAPSVFVNLNFFLSLSFFRFISFCPSLRPALPRPKRKRRREKRRRFLSRPKHSRPPSSARMIAVLLGCSDHGSPQSSLLLSFFLELRHVTKGTADTADSADADGDVPSDLCVSDDLYHLPRHPHACAAVDSLHASSLFLSLSTAFSFSLSLWRCLCLSEDEGRIASGDVFVSDSKNNKKKRAEREIEREVSFPHSGRLSY